jgi:hypothetical protein
VFPSLSPRLSFGETHTQKNAIRLLIRRFWLVKPHNFPGKSASQDHDPHHPKCSLQTKSVTVVQISLVSHAQMARERPQFPFWFFPGGQKWRLPVALPGRCRGRAAEQFQVLVVSTSVRVASSSYADEWMDGWMSRRQLPSRLQICRAHKLLD